MRRRIITRYGMLLTVGLLSACAQMRSHEGISGERPSPARDFVVFFTADNTALDAGGQEVIQGVAATAQQTGTRKLLIQAEASGDSAHAAFLAQDRVKVVSQALEAAGVAPDRLNIVATPRQPDQIGVIARRVTIQFEP